MILPDDKPEIMERILSFLYLRQYHADGHFLQIKPNSDIEPASSNPENEENQDDEEQQDGEKQDGENQDEENQDDEPIDKQDQKNEEDQSMTPAVSKSIALSHIDVFVAADKFGIDTLKAYSANAFRDWLSTNGNSPMFLEVVAHIIESVPSHEHDLLEAVAKTLAENMEHVENKAMLGILTSSGFLGTLLARCLYPKTQRLKKLELANAQLTKDLDEQRKLNEELQQERIFLVPKTLIRLEQNLTPSVNCRHCGVLFNVKLFAGEARFGTFRCVCCTTRHP